MNRIIALIARLFVRHTVDGITATFTKKVSQLEALAQRNLDSAVKDVVSAEAARARAATKRTEAERALEVSQKIGALIS